MNQGQMCLINTRSNAPENVTKLSGWFQKLREYEGNGVYYYQMGGDVKIGVGQVDDSLKNERPTCPYEVVLVVPTELQVSSCHVDDNMIAAVCNYQARREYARLKTQREAKQREFEVANRIKNAIDELDAQIKDIEMALKESERDGITRFYYAYGKHDATGREYCWRIPFVLHDVVRPGVTALVQARDGVERCVVTRVEISPQFLHHKLVIGVENENS